MGEYKISFCTVCMNRLHHLRQTLPANMLNNKNYRNLEFILLDYNSDDGLDDFIKETFNDDIKSGKLIYYKTLTPKYFNRSHSRNMAYKLSTGDIVCNIDADNYTGGKFAAYVNNEFKKNTNIFLTPIDNRMPTKKNDVFGRTCVKKNDFYKIRGYDERMVNYGFEDYDFANRLELSGLTRNPIDQSYLKAITHDEKERLSNEFVSGSIYSVFLNYLTPSSTDCLFLFNNNNYIRGTIVNNKTFKHTEQFTELKNTHLKYTNAILQDEWIEGTWNKNETELVLQKDKFHRETLFFSKEKNCLSTLADKISSGFYELSDPNLIQEAIMFLSQITNRIIMEKNKLEKRIVVNSINFGKDIVYRNFDYQIPIDI